MFWKLRDDATAGQIEGLKIAMRGLKDELRQIRSFSMGKNQYVGLKPPRYEWAMVMDFENLDELNSYLSSESHARVVREHVRPLVEHTAFIDYDMDEV